MNSIKIILLIFLILLYLLHKPIIQNISDFSYAFKDALFNQKTKIENFIGRYTNQAKQIEELRKRVEYLEPKAKMVQSYKSQLNHCLNDLNLSKNDLKLYPVKLLSYVELNDPNRLYLEFKNFDEKRNYGLISQNRVAGIVSSRYKKPLAILISDPKSIFSVMIGKEGIEGVAFGDGENILIKYIPSYKNPKIGDEVVTSGFDELFPYGVQVGRVIKIGKKSMYKTAWVKPYILEKKPRYLYAIDIK